MRHSTRAVVAVFSVLALLAISAAPIAAGPTAPELEIRGKPALGQDLSLHATFPQVAGGQVFFFVAANTGSTVVTLDGVTVTLPVSHPDLVGTVSGNNVSTTYRIPSDRSLVGTSLSFIAVHVVNGVAVMTAVMPTGPIIADDIA